MKTYIETEGNADICRDFGGAAFDRILQVPVHQVQSFNWRCLQNIGEHPKIHDIFFPFLDKNICGYTPLWVRIFFLHDIFGETLVVPSFCRHRRCLKFSIVFQFLPHHYFSFCLLPCFSMFFPHCFSCKTPWFSPQSHWIRHSPSRQIGALDLGENEEEGSQCLGRTGHGTRRLDGTQSP